VFEDQSTNWPVIHTSYKNMTAQTNAALQKQKLLIGTWNFVNDTGYGLGPMADNSERIGTITFNHGRFIQNDQQRGSYSVDWLTQRLNLDYSNKDGNPWFDVYLTFENLGQNHIELSDYHYDIIHLTRVVASPSTTPTSASASVLAAQTKEMLKNEGNNVMMLYEKGRLQADLKNYTGALSDYQKALSIQPRNVNVLADMGRVLYGLQNYTDALQYLNKALTIDPSSVYALEGKALVMYELGYYGRSLVSADRALKLNPLSYSALTSKGISFIKLGNYDQAIKTFDAAIAMSKCKSYFVPYSYTFLNYFDKAIALDDMGLHDHNIGDIHLALQSVNKALVQNPDDKSAQGLQMTLKQILASHDDMR
jgi:tetratricopeptide (TPR) repeat protein